MLSHCPKKTSSVQFLRNNVKYFILLDAELYVVAKTSTLPKSNIEPMVALLFLSVSLIYQFLFLT